jgi:hypothetical protein
MRVSNLTISSFLRITLLYMPIVSFGCETMQGYSGKLLSKHETATVKLLDSRIEVNDIKMPPFSSSISILPGYTKVSAAWHDFGDPYCTAIRGGECFTYSNVSASYLCFVMFTFNAGDSYVVTLLDNGLEIWNSSKNTREQLSKCSESYPSHNMVIVD